MHHVVIVQAGRSPLGKRNGSLACVHPNDMLGPVQMAVLRRAGVAPEDVDQVIGGCINKVGAQAMNITRTAWLSHGGPPEVPATTVDSQCGSSQYAIEIATNLIASGQERVVLACGVENMSRLPVGADTRAGMQAGMGQPWAASYDVHYDRVNQFAAAERIARKWGITRDDADALGLGSQQDAARAIAEGRFDEQIVPLEISADEDRDAVVVTADETPRATSPEALRSLEPVTGEDGIHTAGTSSKIADGAAAVLLMSAEAAEQRGLQPLARIVATKLVGCDPELMLEGPIPATEALLVAAGLSIEDVDVFEINEAFASIVLAWASACTPDMTKVNPNGGAIALGHALGATGCILTMKAAHELRRTGGRYGLISMCCGGGLGTGTLIENLAA